MFVSRQKNTALRGLERMLPNSINFLYENLWAVFYNIICNNPKLLSRFLLAAGIKGEGRCTAGCRGADRLVTCPRNNMTQRCAVVGGSHRFPQPEWTAGTARKSVAFPDYAQALKWPTFAPLFPGQDTRPRRSLCTRFGVGFLCCRNSGTCRP